MSALHDPCCSSHGVTMDCARYRRAHFVEVRPCCSADGDYLQSLGITRGAGWRERTNEAVLQREQEVAALGSIGVTS